MWLAQRGWIDRGGCCLLRFRRMRGWREGNSPCSCSAGLAFSQRVAVGPGDRVPARSAPRDGDAEPCDERPGGGLKTSRSGLRAAPPGPCRRLGRAPQRATPIVLPRARLRAPCLIGEHCCVQAEGGRRRTALGKTAAKGNARACARLLSAGRAPLARCADGLSRPLGARLLELLPQRGLIGHAAEGLDLLLGGLAGQRLGEACAARGA